MKLLFVEDEPILLERMISYFAGVGCICEQAKNFDQAVVKINSHKYDGIVLDIGLPDGSGMDLIPEIKLSQSGTGIVIISANASLADKVDGLNLGADDYLTKPFYLEELNARINALYRRKTLKGDDVITFDDFAINIDARELYYNDSLIRLTKKEFELLIYFVTNKNRLVGKISIAEHIWGDSYSNADNFDAIYVHLVNLRKKLMQASGNDYIKTIWGMGYKFIG
ncbi:response regulator transcription factor [Pedobacter endophyticus]|uniref:Response regulator transcription factor n=1 Tax=Pedobacter endophyticus TaxID=2789740 RepID=A0A7S9KYN5_9SPHI|nr:response regulator transcription factor [Pedobacter endophyticus]QPH39285.1 response regulator transcription factor [Pedobacter endophyticus]